MPVRQTFKNLGNKFVGNTFADFTKTFSFESKVNASDGQGGYTVTWSTFADVRGFVKITSGNEINLDDHIKTRELKKFSFNYIPDLTSEMRILYEGDYYNIHSVMPIQDVDVWVNVIASKDVAT